MTQGPVYIHEKPDCFQLEHEELVTLVQHGVIGHRFRLPGTESPVVDVFFNQYRGHRQVSLYNRSTHALPPRALKEAGPITRPKHTGGGFISTECTSTLLTEAEIRERAEQHAQQMFDLLILGED